MHFNPAAIPAQGLLFGIASSSVAGGCLGPLGNTTSSSTPPPPVLSLKAAPGVANSRAFSLTPGARSRLLNAKASLTYAVSPAEKRFERYALQSVARDVLPASRTAHCHRSLAFGANCVPVKYSPGAKRARFTNLQVCGSVWRCPVCAARISELRRIELQGLIAAHVATGGSVYLVTRTFPHGADDSLFDVMDKLKVVETKYRAGNPWERYRAKFGVFGYVRAFEATYGQHGWHPHIHELLFTDGPVDMEALRAATFARWSMVCVKAGLGAPSERNGVDVRDGTHAAAYVGKWGLDSELTKGHVKKGAKESLSPFDLLRVIFQSSDKVAVNQAKGLYRTYADAFLNKRQLVPSDSLKVYQPEALTDEEAAAKLDDDSLTLGVLSTDGWKLIATKDHRHQVLEAASTGKWLAVERVLDGLRADRPLADLVIDLPVPPAAV